MNICVVGGPKQGKTRSIDTLPGKTIILSSDPYGYEALRKPYVMAEPGSSEALCALLTNNDRVVVDYCAVQRTISAPMTREARAPHGSAQWKLFIPDVNAALMCEACDNIVIDGLTGLSDMVLNAVIVLNKAVNKSNLQAHYGDGIEKLKEIVGVCCANPKHFVLLAHTALEKDELSGRLVERPLVYGRKLPDELLAMFSTVFRTNVRDKDYGWLTNPTGLLETIGSRSRDDLPPRIKQDYGLLIRKDTDG